MLLSLGLPGGWETRCQVMRFATLTLHIASRLDLICLKLWAATDSHRSARRDVDIDDLRVLNPTPIEQAQRGRELMACKVGAAMMVLTLAPVG